MNCNYLASIVCVGALMGLSTTAFGLTTTGSIVDQGNAPLDLTAGALESNSVINLFAERSGHVLSDDLIVDNGPLAASDVITSGTEVDVFLLHFDTVGYDSVVLSGTVAFDGPILGLITTSQALKDTDLLLGSPVTTYSSHNWRGVEDDGQDPTTFSGNTLTIQSWWGITASDELRVLVQSGTVLNDQQIDQDMFGGPEIVVDAAVPEPVTASLLGLAGTVLLMRRRRNA